MMICLESVAIYGNANFLEIKFLIIAAEFFISNQVEKKVNQS